MTSAKYDEVIRRLAAAGAGAPQGRLHHSCYGPKETLSVVDLYADQAAFEAFGGVLMPILAQVGVDPGRPEVFEVHNVISDSPRRS
jgi:hypothetical protein